MINRVLIRIKVVQMLYSYLLTRKEFKIESAPESASRDKKYAYTLYLDLILLILELSGYNVKANGKKSPLEVLGGNNCLSSMKIAKSLINYDEIKSLMLRGSGNIDDFDSIAMRLYTLITSSVAYRDYKKISQPEIKHEVLFWNSVINTIFVKEPLFVETLRKNESFTNVGYETAISMLTNTLSNYSDTRTLLVNARKSLVASLDKGYELYHSILLLMVEITKLQQMRIDAAKSKYLPTYDDLNPNMKFAENGFIEVLINHPDMQAYLSANPISWENETVLVKTLLDKILQSDIYKQYMSEKYISFTSDCEFWRNVCKNIILPSEELAEALEAQSLYWNDDLAIMGTFVLKTIRQFANSNNGNGVSLLPQYKDDEDKAFGPELFEAAVKNAEEYRNYIDKFVNDSQWDPERLAFMDIVIMITAIAELLHFPTIPIPVTLNEYIETANCYSTSKSGQFINGILYSIINYLKSEGKLNKN